MGSQGSQPSQAQQHSCAAACCMHAGAAAGDMDFAGMEEEDEDDTLLPAEGHEFVYADAVADFGFPFQMEEDDQGMSVNSVNEFEDADLEVEGVLDVPVPLNELVSGKVRTLASSTHPPPAHPSFPTQCSPHLGQPLLLPLRQEMRIVGGGGGVCKGFRRRS